MNDLKEFFALREGAKDAEFRAMADASHDLVSKKLKAGTIKPTFEDGFFDEIPPWTNTDNKNSFYVVYDLSSLGPKHEGLELAFGITSDKRVPGGQFSFSTSKKKERITLTHYDKEKKYIPSYEEGLPKDFQSDSARKGLDRWKKSIVSGGAGKFLDDNSVREAYVHEFIHHLDKARISKKGWAAQASKSGSGGALNYFNNPLETNAFTQMGLSSMANHLKNVKTRAGANMLMGGSSQGFAKIALKHMAPEFVKNLSTANRKKLLKRIYQLYTDTMAKMK